MFSPRNENDPLDQPMEAWFDTPERRRARERNWALYIARGMLAQSKWFRGIISPFAFRNLQDVLRDTIYELEQQYPDAPGPKTIRRPSRRNS